MTHNITDSLLSRLSEFIAGRMGLNFPREKWGDLDRAVLSAAKDFGAEDPETFVNEILLPSAKKDRIEILASFLTIGESYFFRDQKSFQVLEQHILPKWIDSRRNQGRRLRIWSAGCATGEEPYSLAILLTRIIPDFKDWDISILATDINPRFLRTAKQGVYPEWSFRDVPEGTRKAYFRKTNGGRYRILPHFKEMVAFSRHNLAEDPYPPGSNSTTAVDLILCRNVIMYFAEKTRKKVVGNFYHCLVEGGCLLVSATEVSHTAFSEYVTEVFPDTTIYRKISGKANKPRDFISEGIRPLPLDADAPCLDGNEILQSEIEFQPKTRIAVPVVSAKLGIEDALALCGMGRYTEAEEKILECLSLSSQDPKALKLLSRVKANQGKLVEAFDWCEKATAADKFDPEGYYLCATILQEQGRIEEAILTLVKSLYVDPDYVLAHLALGNLLRQQGKQKASNRHFKNALALLNGRPKDELIAESEGLSAGRLVEIIRSIMSEGLAQT
jgi:chemotaxis protein methyltransferase CheR